MPADFTSSFLLPISRWRLQDIVLKRQPRDTRTDAEFASSNYIQDLGIVSYRTINVFYTSDCSATHVKTMCCVGRKEDTACVVVGYLEIGTPA